MSSQRPRVASRRSLLEGVLASALGSVGTACIPNGELKRPLDWTPVEAGDGWSVGDVEGSGLDRARVRRIYERVFDPEQFLNALSLLVIKNGELIAEGYVQNAEDRVRKEHVMSVTKSFTSLAFGMARAEGFFPDLDASLGRYLPVPASKRDITLQHLLTMRSGIDVDNDRFGEEIVMGERREVTEWLLAQPLHSAPGTRFDYRDCDPQLLGAAISNETGRSVERWIREGLFGPLSIHDVHWQHDADGEPLTAHGLWLRPRDLAKFAELVRRRGDFEGEELVPASYLDLATSFQSSTSAGTEGFDYGYYFWLVPELHAYSTWGHGGNFTLVVPEEELVLVLTSMPDAGDDVGSELDDVVTLARELLG